MRGKARSGNSRSLLTAWRFACMLLLVSLAPALLCRGDPDNPEANKPFGVLESSPSFTVLGVLDPGGGGHRSGTAPAGRCAPMCRPEWFQDGWCDSACSGPECNGDGGDCLGWCAPDCKTAWIGDGTCDVACFRSECSYDAGDCDKKYSRSNVMFPLPPHEKFNYTGCPTTCSRNLLHNFVCDPQCNYFECNYDGGDCRHQCSPQCPNSWLGDGECDYECNVPNCGFDKGDCKACKEGCDADMVSNGICDPQCDNEACHYDMGDCYGVCWSAARVDYVTEPFFYPHCRTEWKGDGYCDCFCMVSECGYDFGDCDGTDCSLEYGLLRAMYDRMTMTLTEFGSDRRRT